jgi:DoxX-like family
VQERWFARMYLLKPAVFVVVSLFWISTAYVSLGPGWDHGMALMREGGVQGTSAALTVIAGALADLAIGFAIAYRPTSRYGLYAAIGISFAYAIIGTVLVPRLWADPLGPMLKIWPIIVLHFVALAVLDDR